METEVLTRAEHLEPEWWDLWRRDPRATPFQSPAWLVPWRRHFADGENVVVVMREGGRLMALMPFFRLDGRLLLWGAGTSDRLDGVFDPAVDAETLGSALEAPGEPVDLFQLPESSPLLHARAPADWRERRGLSEPCAVLSLPARLGTKMEQNLRYYRRRAAHADVGEPERAGPAQMRALAELHTRRWNERKEPGVFADARFLAWQEEAAALLEAAGFLRLYVLRQAGRIVAGLYVLAARRRAFYYIGGFDPELARLGLGTVLLGHAIAEAEREALANFDFLRGHETYKYRWGAADEATHARYLAPR